jgi:ABC-type branched-subunit amino acid transport system permease subunit
MPGSWLYVLGGLFIVVVLYMPQGITGLLKMRSYRSAKESA